MNPDSFSDLSRDLEVLATLHEMASNDALDQHQVGLARILRFKQNPRLIDAALEHSMRIRKASEILIAEALNVLVSQDLPVHTRTLAARALGHLMSRYPADAVSDFDLDRVIESMVYVLSREPAAPIRQSLLRAVSAARKSVDKRKTASLFP